MSAINLVKNHQKDDTGQQHYHRNPEMNVCQNGASSLRKGHYSCISFHVSEDPSLSLTFKESYSSPSSHVKVQRRLHYIRACHLIMREQRCERKLGHTRRSPKVLVVPNPRATTTYGPICVATRRGGAYFPDLFVNRRSGSPATVRSSLLDLRKIRLRRCSRIIR